MTRYELTEDQIPERLSEKVQDFFYANPHPELGIILFLDHFEGFIDNKKFIIANIGLRDGEISKHYKYWENHLAMIGNDYGFKIILPPEVYKD